MTWNERVQQSKANEYDGLKARCEAAEARADALQRERDEYRTLAKVGQWHNDCRPNRQQAAREIEKQQAVIDKMADAVSAANSRADALAAELAALRAVLIDFRVWVHGAIGGNAQAKVCAELDRLLALRATVAEGKE